MYKENLNKRLRFSAAFECIGGSVLSLAGVGTAIAGVAKEVLYQSYNTAGYVQKSEAMYVPNSIQLASGLAFAAAGLAIAAHGSNLAARLER